MNRTTQAIVTAGATAAIVGVLACGRVAVNSSDANAGTNADGGPPPLVFWYDTHATQTVGMADTNGNSLWQTTVNDVPIQIVTGAGSAWVLTQYGSLIRYDENTHALLSTIAVANQPRRMRFVSGAIWVEENNGPNEDCTAATPTTNDQIVRVDATTNKITGRVFMPPHCANLLDLATVGNDLVASTDDGMRISKIDTTTDQESVNVSLSSIPGAGYLTSTSTQIWVVAPILNESLTVFQLDPTTLATVNTVTGSTVANGSVAKGQMLVSTDDALYLGAANNVLRISTSDPTNMSLQTLRGQVSGLAVENGRLFVSYVDDDSGHGFDAYPGAAMSELDPSTLAEVAKVQGNIDVDDFAFVDN